MYKIIEYFQNNPDATPMEAVSYFEGEFDIPSQVQALRDEAHDIMSIRAQLKPLYWRKSEINEQLKFAISDIEMNVYIQYPPRKGSDAERETLRNKLKGESETYQKLEKELKELGRKITDLEYEMDIVERKSKNARRLTELMQAYTVFISEYCTGSKSEPVKVRPNNNIF